jgi:hypothetical protein
MTNSIAEAVAQHARSTWPAARTVQARKSHKCDKCGATIDKFALYIDPGDANPERAGGFGGYRYCLACASK